MSTVVTRAVKGSPLTYAEMDANFNNLNTDKLQSPLSANVDMGGNKVTGAGAATGNGDLVRYEQLIAKADIASPTFTGDPKAPTPTAGDNDTSIATTAFVAAATAPFTGRNRLVNGNMLIDQEYNGASPAVSTAKYVCDQWASYKATAGATVAAQQQAAGLAGFSTCLVYNVTVGATPGAAEGNNIQQAIEGNNVQDLQWGTANAKTVTLSFWARQPVAGLYGGSLRNSVPNRSYVFTYTITTGNVWQYFSITIPGDTTGAWAYDNGPSIYLTFDLGSGTNNEGTAGAWGAGSYTRTSACLKPITAAGTSAFTGVQFEVGSVATPYENLNYTDQLAQCMRYWERLGAISGGELMITGYQIAGNFIYTTIPFAVTKRATPGVSTLVGTWTYYNASAAAVSSSTIYGTRAQVTITATGTGYAYNNGANACITINARI